MSTITRQKPREDYEISLNRINNAYTLYIFSPNGKKNK